MGDSTTIALNLTFFGTLGLALMMFFGLFLLVVATLVLAGIGRLVALTVMALSGRGRRSETVPVVHLPPPYGSGVQPPVPGKQVPAAAPRTSRAWRGRLQPAQLRARLRTAVRHPLATAARREPPALAKDWASAVAAADARAAARAQEAAPDIRLTVRDLPSPAVPAEKVVAVAPLVESALHQDHPARVAPRSFMKPPAAPPLSLLDTGSLASQSGHDKALKPRQPADRP